MRGLALALCFLVACSGDDNGRHRTTPRPPVADGSAATPAVAPDAAPSTNPTAVLTEAMAQPYFATGPAATGAAKYALEEWAPARDAFAAARKDATAVDAARLDLMIALCDARLAKWGDAARGFTAARAGLPVIADWISYQEARALYFANKPADAMTRARAVPADSIAAADAELLVGDLLRGAGDPAATAAHYRDYLTRRPGGIRRAEARFRLAEALDAGGSKDSRAEMIASYRAIAIDDPLSTWATKATTRLAALKQPVGDYTAAEHITRAKVLFDAMRNPESEAAYDAALAAPGATPAELCVAAYHKAQSRFKARDRLPSVPMFDDAFARCKAAGDKDLQIKSAYQAGRALAFHRKHDEAAKWYRKVQGIDPAHSFNDDAMLREAEEYASLGDDAKVRATLSALPDKFPDGDMRAEALWRLGWRAWKKGKHAEAIDWWKKQIDTVPVDDNYWAEGQAHYWIGRAQAARGKDKDAIASWDEAVRKYPMQYYALLALNRLREAAPDRYKKLVAEIATDPPGFDPKAPAFAFSARPEWATPGFSRAIEFLRLGLGDPAEAELRALDLTHPNDRKRVDDPDLREKLWAIAFLYDRAGRYQTSHWPTRWHILDYRRAWPVGANRARWQIAYPKAYWALLSEHAKKNDVPVAMQIAIVREESAFDPLRESYANAIGLTQMVNSTGTRFAKGTGIAATRENLRDPEKNVTIGSRFLGFLYKHWNRFTHLVPPSYNAGEAGIRKRLASYGAMPPDEFIETILDDQIRNYSKRVLGSFFTYTWLYEGTVPEMPNVIPPDLIPKK
jgi:soluble lytic murein transglycosylase